MVALTRFNPLTGIALAFSVGLLLLALWVSIAKLRAGRKSRSNINGYRLLDGATRGEVVRAYLKALHLMSRRGYPKRQAHESPADYVAKLESENFPVPDTFRRISRLATCALYDPSSVDSGVIPESWKLIKTLGATPKLT